MYHIKNENLQYKIYLEMAIYGNCILLKNIGFQFTNSVRISLQPLSYSDNSETFWATTCQTSEFKLVANRVHLNERNDGVLH
jgi:hypothetical protein